MDIYGKSPALTFLPHPWRTYHGRLHIPRQQTLLSSSHSWAGVSVPRAGDGCLRREVRRGSDRGRADGPACGSGTFLRQMLATQQCGLLFLNQLGLKQTPSGGVLCGASPPPLPVCLCQKTQKTDQTTKRQCFSGAGSGRRQPSSFL